MKNIIESFYNFNNFELNITNKIGYFKYNYHDFIFVPYNRPKEDLEILYNVSLELQKKYIPIHSFIMNNKKELLTSFEDQEYILMMLNYNKNTDINLYDMINLSNNLTINNQNSKLYRNNWGELWAHKIEYFEYQMSKLSKNKKLILNSFSYYLGLAENAIEYYNETNKHFYNNEQLTLSHRRLFSPNYALNYFNPLSFIFDYKSRDIAEYIKNFYFNNDITIEELEIFFLKNNFSNFEANLLFARLLYPSYYFDIYEQVMNSNEDENKLIKIIDKSLDYELFLNDIYSIMIKKNNLLKVDWLIKNQQQ